VIAAIMAQKKLGRFCQSSSRAHVESAYVFHITFAGKKYETFEK
jgi:hypothetical protein